MAHAEPTILIVGAGTFGVSTAYHLALETSQSKPSHITIIDRAPSTPHPAAAADTSRIIRADYASPLYCALANEALHAWFWTPELGPCFHKVGWLLLDEAGSTRTARVHETLRARGSHIMQDVPLSLDDGAESLAQRWGGVLAGTDTDRFARAYVNPDAGWADAKSATARFLETAARKGVKRVVGDVVDLIVNPTTARVEGARMADGRVLRADKVVVAAGAWTSALVAPVEEALGVEARERVERQARAMAVVSAYYRVDEQKVEKMVEGKMPCVIYGQVGEVVPPGRGQGLLKYTHAAARVVNTMVIGTKGEEISVPPMRRDQRLVPEGLKYRMKAGLTSKLTPECARGEPEYWRLCWDSCTPTEDLLLSQHPRISGLYIITGGSFCGYKYAPLVSLQTLPRHFFFVFEPGKANLLLQVPAEYWKVHGEGAGWTEQRIRERQSLGMEDGG